MQTGRPKFVRALCLIAGAAAFALTGTMSEASTANAASSTNLSVVMGYVPDVEDYGFEYALHQGLYAAQGLNVKLIPGGQGIDQVQEVEAGVANIGVDGAEQIIPAVGKGEKLEVFGSEFQKSPVALTCRKDSGVTSPSVMKHKTVTVGVKPTVGPLLNLFLSKNGISAENINQVPIGPSDISEIVAGKVQCEFTTFAFNEPKEIEDQGVKVNVFPLANYGLPAQEDAFFVKKSYYSNPANQATLTKFMKATAKGWMSMFANPKAAAQYEVGHKFVDGLDLNQQIFQAQQQVIYMKSALTKKQGILSVNPASWAATAKNLYSEKVTTSIVPTAELVTNTIVEKAHVPKL